MKATVFRRATFNSAHRLNNPKWDDDKNRKIFGLCNNPNYHGHNYVLIVKLKGEIDPETGYVVDLKVLKEVINSQIIERFDHRNLNLDVPEFKELNPTAENIAVVCWKILKQHLDKAYELTVRLYETEKNYVEYSGE